jgi:hypothetical protein
VAVAVAVVFVLAMFCVTIVLTIANAIGVVVTVTVIRMVAIVGRLRAVTVTVIVTAAVAVFCVTIVLTIANAIGVVVTVTVIRMVAIVGRLRAVTVSVIVTAAVAVAGTMSVGCRIPVGITFCRFDRFRQVSSSSAVRLVLLRGRSAVITRTEWILCPSKQVVHKLSNSTLEASCQYRFGLRLDAHGVRLPLLAIGVTLRHPPHLPLEHLLSLSRETVHELHRLPVWQPLLLKNALGRVGGEVDW